MMLEAQAIAEALGVKFPIDVDRRIDGGAAVGAHRTSMLQDLEAGRPMEIDALVGSVQELGRLTATPTPMIDTVLALVRLRARNGRALRGLNAGRLLKKSGRGNVFLFLVGLRTASLAVFHALPGLCAPSSRGSRKGAGCHCPGAEPAAGGRDDAVGIGGDQSTSPSCGRRQSVHSAAPRPGRGCAGKPLKLTALANFDPQVSIRLSAPGADQEGVTSRHGPNRRLEQRDRDRAAIARMILARSIYGTSTVPCPNLSARVPTSIRGWDTDNYFLTIL